MTFVIAVGDVALWQNSSRRASVTVLINRRCSTIGGTHMSEQIEFMKNAGLPVSTEPRKFDRPRGWPTHRASISEDE